MATKVLHPPIQWAQRKDKIFLTIEIRDIVDEKVELKEPNVLIFSGNSDNQAYYTHLELAGDIDINESKWTKHQRNLQLNIKKKQNGYWKKLTKDDKKYSNISVDWDKYIDEDEEEADQNRDFGAGWDPAGMQGFGGGEDQDDSDDEKERGKNLDDLDKEEDINEKERKKDEEQKQQ